MTRKTGKAMRSKNPRATTDADRIMGERIRTARLKEGISQQALGAQIGVSFQQVQKYEKGMNRVGGSRFTQLAQALNVPIEYFFSNVHVKRSNEAAAIDGFMATRQGIQIMEAMKKLSESQQQAVINLARSLARGGS